MTAAAEKLFAGVLGAERVSVAGPDDRRWAPHPRPAVVAHPRSADEVAALVAAASRERVPLVPVGGNTCPRVPRDGAPPAALVSLEGLGEVVAHEAEDLTLTAGAGLTLRAAQRAVAEARQEVPLSAPFPDRATLGGIVACAAEGPALAAFGPVRDQVLGIEVVHGDGRRTRAGGRVVKNVTGYDLMRLYTGSRGTLGIVTEITFRLRPLPAEARLLVRRYRDPRTAWRRGFRLRAALPDLFGVHLVHGRAAARWIDEPGTVLVVTVCGSSGKVAALASAVEADDADCTAARDAGAASWPVLQTPFPGASSRFQAAVLPSRGAELFDVLVPNDDALEGAVLDVLTGRLELAFDRRWPNDEDHERRLGRELAPLEAWIDAPTDPTFHARRFEHFPSARPGGLGLMAGVMKALDPGSLLNPGRFEVVP